MPNNAETTLVTFLLDRSGSMQSIKRATIAAFNAYLETLKEERAAIDFTFLQFDSVGLDKLCVAEPVKHVPGLTEETFLPRGQTPLVDAAFKTIKATAAAVEARGGRVKVVVCIQTDGLENASTDHTWADLNALIKEKTSAGWQFNFMGAGIDAYQESRRMGIAASSTMSYDSINRRSTMSAFRESALNTRAFASGVSASTAFSAEQRSSAGDRYVPRGLDGSPAKPVARPSAADGDPEAKRAPAAVDDFIL